MSNVLTLLPSLQETLFQKQARLLAESIPELLSPDCSVRLVTENGRSLLAKAGCVASVVEYTKWSGGRHIAVTHVGADLCMRACYMPDTWGLRVFVCDAEGRQKEGAAGAEEVVQDIAGPLCFQVGLCWASVLSGGLFNWQGNTIAGVDNAWGCSHHPRW
jgi:diaminopimelate decarboxylase